MYSSMPLVLVKAEASKNHILHNNIANEAQ